MLIDMTQSSLIDILEEAAQRPNLEIRIKYHNPTNKLKKIEVGDWIDLYVAKPYHLLAGQREYISLGVSMELPRGYEAIVAPRSSTYKKYGLLQTNGLGIIDNSYNGDDDIWMMPVLAMREVWIPEGARLCQFRIQKKQPSIDFVEVESLGNDARGGFGSTGE